MTAPRQVARIYGLERAKKLKRHKVIASTKKNLNNFNNNLIHNGGIMKKTNTVRMLSFAVMDLEKLIDFFNQKEEKINAIEIKTPDTDPYLDIGKGCFIDTVIYDVNFTINKTYELLAESYTPFDSDDFRLISERTEWKYDDDEEGTG